MFGTGLFAPIYRKLYGKPRENAPVFPATTVHSLSMRLNLNEGIQSFMAKGIYEPEQTSWATECLSPGDRFVDIGANFGWYTSLASTRVGPTGEVFAFEPSPLAAGVIATTIQENGLKNITLLNVAVGEADGETQIYLPIDDAVHSPSAFVSDESFVPLEVKVIALDQFAPISNGREIRLVKIDVEGYEPNVLRGMQQIARRGLIKNLICEFNSGWLRRADVTTDELLEQIKSYGFSIHKQTEISTGAEANGDPFECHDVWFKWTN
jgi:FkbM family methyltransferase